MSARGQRRCSHGVVAFAFAVSGGCGRIGFEPAGGAPADAIDTASDAMTFSGPTLGLLSYWRLDENEGSNAVDAVSGNRAVLLSGTMGPPRWVAGKRGSALEFAGASEALEIGSLTRHDNLPAISMAMWFRPSQLTVTGITNCIVDRSGGVSSGGWRMFVSETSPGDLGFRVFWSGNDPIRLTAAGLVTEGGWSHVAVTWDGAPSGAGIRIYVDGVEASYVSTTTAGGARLDDVGSGLSLSCGGALGLEGAVDEVVLYDRELTSLEVQQVMTATQ